MRQTFVLVPPSLQITPPSGQVVTRKGGPVSFECRANGNPNPTVQWSKRCVWMCGLYNSNMLPVTDCGSYILKISAPVDYVLHYAGNA
ncbi:hypothetical protein YQE_06039, partial [Dendroctonus ponderosae]